MQLLSIGNSFSADGQRYVSEIARADKVTLNTFNLMIGGCSLETHYRNMLSEERVYELGMNGKSTGFRSSIKEALLSQHWDIVTLQQNSGNSFKYETYQPYMNELAAYVRRLSPKAKIVIHQTWAYRPDATSIDHRDMFRDLKEAYDRAAQDIEAYKIIPSGAVFQELIAAGETEIHRDMLHADTGIGRYALGLIWYAVLTGRDITNNTFCDFDKEVTPEQMELAKKCVKTVYEQYYGE